MKWARGLAAVPEGSRVGEGLEGLIGDIGGTGQRSGPRLCFTHTFYVTTRMPQGCLPGALTLQTFLCALPISLGPWGRIAVGVTRKAHLAGTRSQLRVGGVSLASQLQRFQWFPKTSNPPQRTLRGWGLDSHSFLPRVRHPRAPRFGVLFC